MVPLASKPSPLAAAAAESMLEPEALTVSTSAVPAAGSTTVAGSAATAGATAACGAATEEGRIGASARGAVPAHAASIAKANASAAARSREWGWLSVRIRARCLGGEAERRIKPIGCAQVGQVGRCTRHFNGAAVPGGLGQDGK